MYKYAITHKPSYFLCYINTAC